MVYKVYRVDVDMLYGEEPYLPYEFKTLTEYLNGLKGKVVAIIPNVDWTAFGMARGVTHLVIIVRLRAV